jgi:hypothetical protein
MGNLDFKKEVSFTRDVAVDTSVKYYKELGKAIDHPTTLPQLSTFFIRLSGPLLILFGLIILTVAFFKAMNTPEGTGMNAILVSQTNEEITAFKSFFQIFPIRTGQYTGTTFTLPDPTSVRPGTTITVRNASDNLNGLNPRMSQGFGNPAFVDGPTRNTITVVSFDGFSEVIQPFADDGIRATSQTYLSTKGPDGIQRWYHAGLSDNTL